MLCRSVKPLPGYRNFYIVSMPTSPSSISLDLKFVTDQTATRAELRHRAKFRSDRSNRCWDISILVLFILDFWNFKFLTVGTVKKIELHHRAKFRQDQSKCGPDMAIFRFSKMAAAAILDFRNFKFLTVGACQISSKSVEPRPRYGDFSIFPRWRPSAILDL